MRYGKIQLSRKQTESSLKIQIAKMLKVVPISMTENGSFDVTKPQHGGNEVLKWN